MVRALLTVDCGNSTITCHDDVGGVWSTASTAPDFASLADFVAGERLPVLAVSVVPAALAAARSAFAGLGMQVEVAGVDRACPLQLAYGTPETLGADRWVGALAAHRRHGAAVTVDCGTATTVNLVTAAGVFEGGAIGPGPGAIVAGMRATAPALPLADLDASPAMPGATTQECVDAGVLLGWCGAVERLVAEAQRRLPKAPLVVTGGNAARLLAHSSLPLEHRPALLHEGLRALAGAAP